MNRVFPYLLGQPSGQEEYATTKIILIQGKSVNAIIEVKL